MNISEDDFEELPAPKRTSFTPLNPAPGQLSAIRAALEAAARKATEVSNRLKLNGDTEKMYGANQVLHALCDLSPPDILKGMK